MYTERTKSERISHVERNLQENDRNLAEGKISEAQHRANRKDGKECIREIRARKK